MYIRTIGTLYGIDVQSWWDFLVGSRRSIYTQRFAWLVAIPFLHQTTAVFLCLLFIRHGLKLFVHHQVNGMMLGHWCAVLGCLTTVHLRIALQGRWSVQRLIELCMGFLVQIRITLIKEGKRSSFTIWFINTVVLWYRDIWIPRCLWSLLCPHCLCMRQSHGL